MSAIARTLALVATLAGGCVRVHIRRAALEELAATVAAGIAAHASHSAASAHACPAHHSSQH